MFINNNNYNNNNNNNNNALIYNSYRKLQGFILYTRLQKGSPAVVKY